MIYIKVKIHNLPRTVDTVGTNYKIFDYNKIFEDYLKMQNRVLFIEFEKFLKIKMFQN